MTYLVPGPVFVIDRIRFTIINLKWFLLNFTRPMCCQLCTKQLIIAVVKLSSSHVKIIYVYTVVITCIVNRVQLSGSLLLTRLTSRSLYIPLSIIHFQEYRICLMRSFLDTTHNLFRPYASCLNSNSLHLFVQSISRYDIPYLNARHNRFNLTTRFRIQ